MYISLALSIIIVAKEGNIKQLKWTQRPVENAVWVVNGAYFDTKTGHLAAAVIIDGKVISGRGTKTPRPAFVIPYNKPAFIEPLQTVTSTYATFASLKIPVKDIKLLIEGDWLIGRAPSKYSFIATNGEKVWLGAAFNVPFEALKHAAKKRGFSMVMRLDGGSSTWAASKWSKKLNNALVLIKE